MKNSTKEIIINHSAKDVFNIVLDIEKYPDYIPWCKEIIVNKRLKNEIFADMVVNYNSFINQTFSSHVYFDKKNFSIKTKYIDGPLKDLNTEWLFFKIEDKKTKVLFKIDFEFKKFFHQKIAELFFSLIEDKMINSFVKRADQILN